MSQVKRRKSAAPGVAKSPEVLAEQNQKLETQLNTLRNCKDREEARAQYRTNYRTGLAPEQRKPYLDVLKELPRRNRDELRSKLQELKSKPTREQARKEFRDTMQGLSPRDRARFRQALRELPSKNGPSKQSVG